MLGAALSSRTVLPSGAAEVVGERLLYVPSAGYCLAVIVAASSMPSVCHCANRGKGLRMQLDRGLKLRDGGRSVWAVVTSFRGATRLPSRCSE